MNWPGREHVGGEDEAAGLQHLGDALADQIGLGRGLPPVRFPRVIGADELACLLQGVLALFIAAGQVVQVGRYFQPVHRLQPDGHSPVVPPRLCIGGMGVGLIGEVVEAIGRHSPSFSLTLSAEWR